MVRLQKFLAEAGVASRRASELIIQAGRVQVNGQTARVLGTRVNPVRDTVMLDGQVVRPRKRLYLALNKPRGYLCTRRDELARRTIFELLPKEWDNLQSVGRLDADSEGLLLLTNDGAFSLRVSHPRHGVRKTYVATVGGRVQPPILQRFQQGISHHGERLRAERTRLLAANNSHSVVELELAEGKNREVRRLFESQGLVVERLRRVRIGCIRLGELRPGRWRALTETEIKSLLAP